MRLNKEHGVFHNGLSWLFSDPTDFVVISTWSNSPRSRSYDSVLILWTHEPRTYTANFVSTLGNAEKSKVELLVGIGIWQKYPN